MVEQHPPIRCGGFFRGKSWDGFPRNWNLMYESYELFLRTWSLGNSYGNSDRNSGRGSTFQGCGGSDDFVQILSVRVPVRFRPSFRDLSGNNGPFLVVDMWRCPARKMGGYPCSSSILDVRISMIKELAYHHLLKHPLYQWIPIGSMVLEYLPT